MYSTEYRYFPNVSRDHDNQYNTLYSLVQLYSVQSTRSNILEHSDYSTNAGEDKFYDIPVVPQYKYLY